MCSSLVHLTTTARDPSLATASESTISRLLKRKISFKFELINIANFFSTPSDSHGKKQHQWDCFFFGDSFCRAVLLQLLPPIYWRKESFWYTIWQAENQFLQCSALISIFFCVCCEFDKRKQMFALHVSVSHNISPIEHKHFFESFSSERKKMQISGCVTLHTDSAHLSRGWHWNQLSVIDGVVSNSDSHCWTIFSSWSARSALETHLARFATFFVQFLCAYGLSSPRTCFGETPRSNRVICYIGCRSVYFVFSSLHAADLSAPRLVKWTFPSQSSRSLRLYREKRRTKKNEANAAVCSV